MERRKIKNHLDLFPKEIWEMTLEQMENSKDILSLLRGIPKMDITITSRKKYWLIDQIIPFLYKLINKKDILNLRLVCKQWQRRVDFFLPNQPYYRAYSEDLHKEHPDFWGFLDESKPSPTTFYLYLLTLNTTTAVDNSTTIDKILEYSRPINPFILRKLYIITSGRKDNLEEFNFRKLFSFLERFGAHVWYLSFIVQEAISPVEIDVLVRMLRLMGNLKGLAINLAGQWGCNGGTSGNNVKLFKRSLPDLKLLETLNLHNNDVRESTKIFLEDLMKEYGSQIRRLILPEELWKVQYKDFFSQLTEFKFWSSYSGKYTKSGEMAEVAPYQTLVDSILSPRLVKLHLCFYSSYITINIEDVLKWLKRFPQIKYLEMDSRPHEDKQDPAEMLILKEDDSADPTKNRIHSLQILKIVEGHGLSYNFLRCFPSLRELELRPYCFPSVNALTESNDSFKLREQIQTAKIYESNIWELMPKLRKICLFPPQDEYEYNWRCWSFTRDIFEKLKKEGTIPVEPQFYSFRQDIQNFMKAYTEAESESDFPSDDDHSEEDN